MSGRLDKSPVPVYFSYAKHLGKYRQVKLAEETTSRLQPEAKIITTVGTQEKKILRKYVKKDRGTVLTRKPEQPLPPPPAATPPPPVDAEPPSSAASASRAMARRLSVLGKKADAELRLQKTSFVNLANCIRSKARGGASTPVAETLSSPRTPSGVGSRLENPYSKQFNTPRRKRQASSTDEFSSSETGGQSPAVLPVTPTAATPLAKKARKDSSGGAMGRSPIER